MFLLRNNIYGERLGTVFTIRERLVLKNKKSKFQENVEHEIDSATIIESEPLKKKLTLNTT